MNTIKKLLPYISKYKIYSILAPITVAGEVFLEICIPLLMARIIDIGITNNDINYIFRTGGFMILLALISLTLGALSGKFAAIASMGFAKELRKGIFYKIQDFSFSNIDKFSTSSLVMRLTTDITNTQNSFMMIIRMLIRAPIMLIGATFMAFSINSHLVKIFFVAIPILALSLVAVLHFAFPKFQEMLKKYDTLESSIQENLTAIRVVKAFVRSDYEKEKFQKCADDLRQSQMGAEKIIMLEMPVMQLVMYGCMISVVWFGGNMIIAGNMLTGELMSFISYITQILMSLMMIAMVFVNIAISRASVSRIIEVLDEDIDIKDYSSDKDIQLEDGSISFENISFTYNNSKNEVLENINFKIESGETIGIIGGTGSSKTTLVQLIPRLYDVTKGTVIVGGHDVKNYKLEILRDSVGMVLQKNVLFSGTIKENLRWGNKDATDEQIIQACKAAQAHDFIMSFPDKYDTDLGQGGVNVSGGQKQRLCIARALLKNPKIIVLDDSTSAVDTATDANIRKAFKENLKNTTTIIIAQRITSVNEADRIIVLNEGKIDAIGTHEQLLQNNDIYKEVYNSQQKGVAENA